MVRRFPDLRRCSRPPAPQQPVVGRGHYQKGRGHRRAQQGREEHAPLQGGQRREPLGERDREKEREEHLHTGQDYPELLQELDYLPSAPFLTVLPLLQVLLHNRPIRDTRI